MLLLFVLIITEQQQFVLMLVNDRNGNVWVK